MASPELAPVLLEVEGLRAGYGAREVLFGVDLSVAEGEVVALFGHNGAGKTTALRSIFGVHRQRAGSVRWLDCDLSTSNHVANVRRGMAYVPAERFVFSSMSVRENLQLGGVTGGGDGEAERLEAVLRSFPLLHERYDQPAGSLSGGQQRMLSVGIALIGKPRLLLLDEPSLGLSPAATGQVMQALAELVRGRGLSVLMVEQNVGAALELADRAYVVRSGRTILEETAAAVSARGSLWDLF